MMIGLLLTDKFHEVGTFDASVEKVNSHEEPSCCHYHLRSHGADDTEDEVEITCITDLSG